MLRYLAGLAGIASLVSLGYAQSYARTTNDLRVGVVLIDSAQSNGQPIDYTPYVWFNLDADTAIKPAGWNLYNPAALSQVTQTVANRWGAMQVGQRLSKANAAYWEVVLSQMSDTQIAQYDALELSAYGYTSLTSIERDKLRKFVDQGGVLWIDLSSTANIAGQTTATFPLPVGIYPGGGPLVGADPFSPLTTTPYSLGLGNLEQSRSDTALSMRPFTSVDPTDWQIESWLITDYGMHFRSVATVGSGDAVLLGQLGDGYVVVTSSAVAYTLNRVPTGGGSYSANNQFEASSPAYDQASQSTAKFVVNLLSLSSTYSQVGNGARKQHEIPIDLQPPLLSRNRIPMAGIAQTQAPVLYKGLLIVSAGNTLKVYDANPATDQDLDGNPDDGLPDYIKGAPYDELWEYTCPAPISAPTCVEVPSAAIKDQIFVVDANGNLYAFDAFNVLNGKISGWPSVPGAKNPLIYGPVSPPGNASAGYPNGEPEHGPYAPTAHDGLLYIASVQTSPLTGEVWAFDPQSQTYVNSGGNPWYLGVNGTQTLPEPSASPTIGYIPVQDNSGAYDLVMYLPGRPTNTLGPTGTASITSLWMGVRGESPAPDKISFNQGLMVVTTRAGVQGLNVYDGSDAGNDLGKRGLGIKLSCIHTNTGDPFSDADMSTYFTGQVIETSPGVLEFPEKNNLDVNTIAGGVTIRVDYTIDWAPADYANGSSFTTSAIRGQLYLPDDYQDVTTATDRRYIVGNIAMSPRGTIYCVTSTEHIPSGAWAANPNGDPQEKTMDCGSYYAIREDIGRGGFRLLTRYDLYPRHNIPLNQIVSGVTEVDEVNYEQTFEDTDGLLSLVNTPYLQGKDFSHET
ncbi:MAG TPA: PQQ-binding-like beta-propeller repeat protein, partial [Fimbriimonadaceae bacterium]|nr:PQQ-binding-like beta-propeller repeat protein [Fimbriimonadaceae bacterium]